MQSLKGIKVLDLTQRLPGPLACKILMDQGAEIKKVSPLGKQDAFEKIENILFNHWYKSFNSGKEILEASSDEMNEFIKEADIIIAPFNFKIKSSSLKEKVLIKVHGSQKDEPMHDLNALAQTKSFYLFTHNKNDKKTDPPFLPFAGISYAQDIALNACTALFELERSKRTVIKDVYLDKSVQSIFNLFWSEELNRSGETKFLHNGVYPCYNIYRTSDNHFIALACVEEHYWQKFSDLFNLSLKIEDRFDTSNTTFNKLIKLFSESTLSSIINTAEGHNICLTPVE